MLKTIQQIGLEYDLFSRIIKIKRTIIVEAYKSSKNNSNNRQLIESEKSSKKKKKKTNHRSIQVLKKNRV